MTVERSESLVKVTLLVRDKKGAPLIGFPLRGSYVGGTRVFEKKTDSKGLVTLRLQADTDFEIRTYTVNNKFELNATINPARESKKNHTIIGVERLASEFMATLNVSIMDLDRGVVRNAKFIRNYMGKISELTCDSDGKKQLRMLLGEPLEITPLKADGQPFPRSTFKYTFDRVSEHAIVVTLPIHQHLTETAGNKPTTNFAPLVPSLSNSTNGHFYNMATGQLIAAVTTGRDGGASDVYACSGYSSEPGGAYKFAGAVRIGIPAGQFRTACSIVKHEGVTEDENEYICIAFASRNQADSVKRSMYALLMSSYSSVPTSEKIELPDGNNSTKARAARKGVLMALSNQTDPTNGSRYWDGTDFLSWGLHSPNGTPQNKFEEYKEIIIPKAIYDSFLRANLAKYKKGSVRYSGKFYKIPATVFSDPGNWSGGAFSYSYSGASRRPYSLKAEVAAGLSIFWSVQ
jgi:hypothetical protein